MHKKKQAHALMNETTDSTSDALRGVDYQDSGSITKQFDASVDEVSELSSAKAKKND